MCAAVTTELRCAPAPAAAPPDESPHLAYHSALDGLRAVAVLAVIAYHDGYDWARGGFLGVDTFFVLSGFLITTLLALEYRRDHTIGLTSFWIRRARRLLPALFLVLLFVAVYTHLAVIPYERERVSGDGIAGLLYVTNWRFILDGQSYFQLFAAASPLRHLWSLAIEEQFYLVWPLVVFACLRAGRGSTRVLAAVCICGIAVSLAAMQMRFLPDNPTNAYYATDARAHSLLVGALLALLLGRTASRYRAGARSTRSFGVMTVLAAGAMLVAFHSWSATDAAYYRGGSLAFAAVSAVVIAGVMRAGPVSSALSWPSLVWIGRISYGLYLWHWPVNVWLVPSRVDLGPDALNALRLAVTFAAATASYYLIERPIREHAFRPRAALRAFVPAAVVVGGAVLWSAAGSKPPPSYLVGGATSPAAAFEATDEQVAAAGMAAETLTAGFAAVPDVPPPEFSWGYGDPLLCGEPRPEETAEAVEATADNMPLGLAPGAGAERVLLLGDSTACSLWPGLRAVGDTLGIATGQASVFGCGIAVDEFTSTRNEAVTPSSDRCRTFLDWAIPRALARLQPTVVVWMSTWEKSDLVVDDRTVVAATPEWEAEITARMDTALARLTAGGARVVVVTQAPPAPNPAQGTETYDRAADDAGYARLDDLLRRFAARHRDDVSLVDLAGRLCPGGPPCPERVDGLHARPDGRHFTPTAAVWAARMLLSETFGAG